MEKSEDKKRKRLRLLISISLSGTLFLATVLFVMWFVILQDQNRNQHVRSNKSYTEIINKNYVKAFENTENTGKFTYFLPEEDINDLLADGVKSVKDKRIDSVYFEYSDNGTHVFYADLKRTFIKTRVVLTTYVQDYGTDYVNLKILTTKIGKLEYTKGLVKKGYLTSKWMDNFFKSAHLPITYSEKEQTFKVEVKKYINDFQKTKISENVFDVALKNKGAFSVNPANLGFTVDFSKVRLSSTIEVDNTVNPIPNFYDELKNGCEAVDFSALNPGDSALVYSISESNFSNLLKASLGTEFKEKITYGSSEVVFDLVDAQASFSSNDEIKLKLIFSLNGYFVDLNTTLNLYDYSSNYFDSSIEINYDDNFSSQFLEVIFENLSEKVDNFADFSELSGSLNIELSEMNAAFLDADLKNSFKTVELNSATKTIDFIVTKVI